MVSNIELISEYNPILKNTDPELVKILDNFLIENISKNNNLTDRTRLLVILATLIANGSQRQYQHILIKSLDSGLNPNEIKEMLYQSIPYIGLAKAYDFLDITNNTFKDFGIDLPLNPQSTTNPENRVEKGYGIQVNNFGKTFIDNAISEAASDEKDIWEFINGFAYGDFYTRNGLSINDRELLSFTYILSLRGCENQLRIHVKGNLNVGNTRSTLVSVVSVLIPYIGFPRVHNALAIIDEICGE